VLQAGHSYVDFGWPGHCLQLTVIGYSSWTPDTAGGLLYTYFDCASVAHNGPVSTSTSKPTDFPAHTCVTEIAIAADPATLFTITYKVEAVC
jgi:hypothetical protein